MDRDRTFDVKTFVKDGKKRVAYTPAEAVSLRFDGWTEEATPRQSPSTARTTSAKADANAKADTTSAK